MIRKLFNAIKYRFCMRSGEAYVKYLRNSGVTVGEGTYFQSPKTTSIDLTRPSLITIGRNCIFGNYIELVTHDWVSNVFINSGREMINSSGAIVIGDNVQLGRNIIVLKGVTIGDNCYIAAHSLVNKSIPPNSIAGGVPAKVLTTLDEYYNKRLELREAEAFEYARSIVDRFNRRPVPADFWEEFPLFMSGDEVDKYPEIPVRKQLGVSYDRFVANHKAPYPSFDAFLKEAKIS